MSSCRQYILSMCAVLMLLTGNSISGDAQSLVNEQIQVAADALTVLKFNGEITHCELGMRDGFTCLVRDNDNTVVIKTLDPGPASTNLAITEGKRTHYFILVFLKKIDINNTKLFYDYSDLKALRRLVARQGPSGNSGQVMTEAATEDKPVKKSKKEEAAEKKRKEAEQKKIDEELARQQEQQRQKALAAQQEQQHQKDLIAAREAEKKRAAAEKIRIAKESKEAAAAAKVQAAEDQKLAASAKALEAEERKATAAKANAAEENKIAAAKKKPAAEKTPVVTKPKEEVATAKVNTDTESEAPKKLSRREERALRKQKEQEAAVAAAKAEETRKQEEAEAAAKEKARQDELERREMIAAEAARKKQEALQKQQDAVAAKAKAKEDARLKQQALAKAKAAEKEEARLRQQALADEREAQRKDAAEKLKAIADIKAKEAANPLLLANLRKKYPAINFADIPEGQMITGEYFRAMDTLENYQQCMRTLSDKPLLNVASNSVGGIDMNLEDIDFSGVNAYLRVHIRNSGKTEYLAGKMLLRWNKEDGDGYNLYACYVTGFPVIPAGGAATIVYVARGVNAQDGDKMYFSLSDRVHEGYMVEIPFSGKVYNKEMMRK